MGSQLELEGYLKYLWPHRSPNCYSYSASCSWVKAEKQAVYIQSLHNIPVQICEVKKKSWVARSYKKCLLVLDSMTSSHLSWWLSSSHFPLGSCYRCWFNFYSCHLLFLCLLVRQYRTGTVGSGHKNDGSRQCFQTIVPNVHPYIQVYLIDMPKFFDLPLSLIKIVIPYPCTPGNPPSTYRCDASTC